jgi:hypothetical protein
MIERTAVTVVVAWATLVAPVIFLLSIAIAGIRRSRGMPVGPRFTALVTVLGGTAIGLMLLLLGGDLLVAWPLLGTIAVLEIMLLRRGRLREAGWLLAGSAAPWTVLWGVYLAAVYLGRNAFDFWHTWLGFLAGAVPMLFGLTVALVRRLPVLEQGDGRAAAPTGRQLGDIGRAIMAPARVGPFGLPEVGLLSALVATWFVGSLILPGSIPEPIRLAVLVVLASLIGTEAWLLSMPAPARRAFEAFSWLGDWEMARVRLLTGGGVPTTARGAREWLLAHPERAEERWIRVEILLLARRLDEALAVAERMGSSSPQERLERTVALDLAEWFAGRDGDLAAIEAATRALDPGDPDARLRAEVAIAVAKVRRRLAEGVDLVEVGAPLREVRQRLGSRADGQLGRAMRPRLRRAMLVVGAAFAAIVLLLEALMPVQ